MILSDASRAQHRAANPQSSTWLSANAGSGKTKVLIDRVARLLLLGTSPQNILCLTYTKAAATEMQNRLFERLGAWAMMPEPDLRKALQDLGHEGALDPQALAQARQLFARAIESPGGLRIQTIHSFCATLLRRFPLEAGVSPAFQEMDDRAARLMREAIIEDMAETTAPDAVQALAQYHTGEDFLKLMAAIAGKRGGFAMPLDLTGAKRLFDVPSNQTEDALLSQVFLGGEAELVNQLLPYLQNGSAFDIRDFKKLSKINLNGPSIDTIRQLEGVFLFGAGTKAEFSARLTAFPTKPTRLKLNAALNGQLDTFMLRVEAARPARIALQAAHKTAALHAFARFFLPLYQQAKAARGLLDFDDLIERTIHLLTDRSVAAWVLYRLDGGIDHILVDEAQDTSPKQWEVVRLLAEEFTAGLGAAKTQRTLFVVGDKKQSIYSFQGADIAIFDAQRRDFEARFQSANLSLDSMELVHSFRSSPAILNVVDNVFASRFPRAMGDSVKHVAHFDAMPGRVDLWPTIEAQKSDTNIDPIDTNAQISQHSAQWELAQNIAEFIQDTLQKGTQIPTKGASRPATAGDFLILVQRRSDIFHSIIRACKKLNLPIAGADRLRLGGELAVRDLTAMLSFLATPEDDLSLAAALRSPLLGLDEAQLFDLAHGRSGYLWEVVRNSDHTDILGILTDLRDSADYLRPYDLIERMLTRHDGRRKLIARLGPEAEEGIDEMLSQALAYERGEIPSLTGFLLWLDADDLTIKRQVDSAGDLIRVMTVHGAKGLEAPIVILPDTAERTKQDRDDVVELDNGALAWRTNKDESPPAMAARAAKSAQADEDESLRLLYVALTRAQSWLIVAAAGKVEKPDCWHKLVQQGLDAAGAVPATGSMARYAFGAWPDVGTSALQPTSAPVALPDWALAKTAQPQRPPQPFAPSRLTGAKTVVANTDGDSAALALGTAVHLLLEHLPSLPLLQWPEFANRVVPELASEALATAANVLNAPHLRFVFESPLAEVPITAPLEKGQMLGIIDRLVITPTEVLAVDFKTNAEVPKTCAEVPSGILAQMGAYHAALVQIYPEKAVTIAILWTSTATLMQLDHDMMRQAFNRAAIS